MGRKKKELVPDVQQQAVQEEQPKQKSCYKTFKELTEQELDVLLLYENKVARISGKYITELNSKSIKDKYGNCTFPPFVLDMMSKVIRHC